jgi:hypothetical protein
MQTHSAPETAAAYLAKFRGQGSEFDWAFDSVLDITFSDSWEELWEFVLAFSRLPETIEPEAMAFFAAGPLEDLICKAGAGYVDRVLAEAVRNSTLGRMLTGVWGYSADPVVWDKVVRFCRAFPDPIDGAYRNRAPRL